jgi:hypothetical protein
MIKCYWGTLVPKITDENARIQQIRFYVFFYIHVVVRHVAFVDWTHYLQTYYRKQRRKEITVSAENQSILWWNNPLQGNGSVNICLKRIMTCVTFWCLRTALFFYYKNISLLWLRLDFIIRAWRLQMFTVVLSYFVVSLMECAASWCRVSKVGLWMLMWELLVYKTLLLVKYSGTSVYVRFGISLTWYTSCLDAKNVAWYTTFVWNTTRVLGLVWVKMSPDTARYSPPQQGKVRLNFHLFHLIAFSFMYFSIKQCLNYFIQLHQCTI